jgi:phenylalanyl-tRNA synthetase alpha chain
MKNSASSIEELLSVAEAKLNELKAEHKNKSPETAFNDKQHLVITKALFFGREGYFKLLFNSLKGLEEAEKVNIAAKINSLKVATEEFFLNYTNSIKDVAIANSLIADNLDFTLPAITPQLGRIHPLIEVGQEITELLACYGFKQIEGPEVEDEFYCFDSLNIPPHHPARDMQDTFYTDNNKLLRTHTTSVQSRILESSKGNLPIKIAVSGRVYRNESLDTTHTDMFHQYEGLWVESGIKFSHLLELLGQVVKELYGRRRKVRFVQKFYPYTEPSVGVLVNKSDNSGWSTVGGAGIVHRKVLEQFNIDPKKVSGLAFGLGTTRLVAERYGFPHLKAIYQNELRVLKNL